MSSPLFFALGGGNDMMSQFNSFVQRMQGVNPTQEINRLLQSGQITQAQLNQAQQMANQIMGIFQKK